MNCENCQHQIRQRADSSYAHAKIEYSVKEPKSKIVSDALYLARKCMEPNCTCENPSNKNEKTKGALDLLKGFGEGIVEAGLV